MNSSVNQYLEARRGAQVNGKTLHFKKAVVASGGSPRVPAIPGLADVPYLTNRTLFNLHALPPRMVRPHPHPPPPVAAAAMQCAQFTQIRSCQQMSHPRCPGVRCVWTYRDHF
jgi:hypothetical protein